MQQIYMQSDEQFEIFTTVFSPQLCRTRTRTRPVDDKVVAAINYRAHGPEELEMSHGDVVQVLFREDHSWWFGRLKNGNEGYFPSACVTPYVQDTESAKVTPNLLRRGSVPAVMATLDSPSVHGGGRRSANLPRKSSLLQVLGQEPGPGRGSPAPQGSPSLLHRVLAKSRRKSCPHLPHGPPDSGSVNAAFQSD